MNHIGHVLIDFSQILDFILNIIKLSPFVFV